LVRLVLMNQDLQETKLLFYWQSLNSDATHNVFKTIMNPFSELLPYVAICLESSFTLSYSISIK
jgi:hypothetical protein